MSDDDARSTLHPALRVARYGKHDDGDRFLGFLLSLMIDARQHRLTPSLTRMRRTIEAFYSGRDVKAAREAVGQETIDAQLRDAAAVYFQTCLTDPQYSSVVWGMNRLQPEQLRAKAAKDAAGTLEAVVGSRATGPAEALPGLFVDGFIEVFGDPGREALRDAAAKKPSLAGLGLV
ncbi:DUF6553 family protein [Tessaracoccus sp. G1721]